MTKENSFAAYLGKVIKKNAALAKPDSTEIKVTVGKVIALCQGFHEAGFNDGYDALSYFEKLFGK